MNKAVSNLISLNGKRTLLTGAFGGFGRAILDLFVQHGQEITAISRRSIDSTEAGANVECIQLDLKEHELVKRFIKESEPFDNVVFCHGTRLVTPVPLVTIAAANDFFDTNFMTRINLISNLIKYKKVSQPGRIVNISSISVHYASKLVPIYASAHSAAEAYMRSAAKYFLKKGVTVNSVAVNAIATPLWGEQASNHPVFDVPLGPGEADDVAKTVYFLCQNGATFITGETLILAGGQRDVFE